MLRQWFKNLAQAQFVNGQWLLDDKESALCLAHEYIKDFVPELCSALKDALEIHNLYCDPLRQLKLFKLSLEPGSPPCGVMLMLNKLQVKIELRGLDLKSEGILNDGFHNQTYPMQHFRAQHDPFGEVFWYTPKGQPYTLEMLVRQFLIDTIKFGFLTKQIKSPYLDSSNANPQPQQEFVAQNTQIAKKSSSFFKLPG